MSRTFLYEVRKKSSHRHLRVLRTRPTDYQQVILLFSYITNMNKEILHACSHKTCVGFWVFLTSELLKLTHENAFKDFYLSQHAANGVTGNFMHTNVFLKNLNPLICEVSGHHVIASNFYHPFIRRFF